jgi:hypothetical protein
MRHITPISKKNRCRQILILSVCILILTSCHEFDSLPNKINTNYSLAFPVVVDTTILVGDFAGKGIYNNLIGMIEIPAGDTVKIGEQAYSFYIGDYFSSQEIEWVEPRMILDSTNLPSGTIINLGIYTENESKKDHFWLPKDYPITLGDKKIIVPETPKRIENIEQFRSSRIIYVNTSIVYPTAMSGEQIVNNKLKITLAIKFAIKPDLKVNI